MFLMYWTVFRNQILCNGITFENNDYQYQFWFLQILNVIKFYLIILQAYICFKEANAISGSVEFMHFGSQEKGYYLPILSSKVIYAQYILNVALGKCYRVLRSEVVQEFQMKKSYKLKLGDKHKENKFRVCSEFINVINYTYCSLKVLLTQGLKKVIPRSTITIVDEHIIIVQSIVINQNVYK
ncbi:hypothetical protein pb186bvf_001390 [Paramecium bursaria]